MFKQNQTKLIKLDLKKVILLDNCFIMDLLCNYDLIENITKTENKMTVQVNCGNLVVSHKATVPLYKQDVWFIKDAITNIMDLENLTEKYRVTYYSINHIFVVHK